METGKYAKSHRDLIVYQKARSLAQEVFELTKLFPLAETHALTDQVRRASRSVGAQIAEAWAERPYEKHFISKLTDADAEQHETQHWLETARDCGYISPEKSDFRIAGCQEVGRLLGAMVAKASLFCSSSSHSIREPHSEYFVDGL